MHACRHACMPVCIHVFYTHIHIYIYIYIHLYISFAIFRLFIIVFCQSNTVILGSTVLAVSCVRDNVARVRSLARLASS